MFIIRKLFIYLVTAISLTIILSACGEKSQEDVIKQMDKQLDEMSGYKAKAEMKMYTGKEDQVYNIDIWHKKKDFYRVALSNNEDEKGNQIILKNDDGVFVLTPALDKSFKFQTEWPQNSSQPYLFQSLYQDIKDDKDATFKVTDSHYVFHTKTNYQSNNNLPFQEVYIDKKTYVPVLVKVLDKDNQAIVEVKFANFDTKPSFEDKDFALEENMSSSAVAEKPVSKDVMDEAFTVLFPEHTAGAELVEQKDVDLENGQRVIMSYSGDKSFTLIQEKPASVETLSSPKEVPGDIVNLGHSIGALTESGMSGSIMVQPFI
ncbi:LolA family protein [Paracerasibacillus soli]|uniref:Outer membrane lipoprotein carrier protein LolA n=1 Tax=Paracerasibacillus soli TaxID=480284 RepID=A0ABU5CW23_9BACI|nr:outer membrane lipoprotein carrier protein LolA [Virgibacillus soli]MDY0410450.1 outer membrane lipoprotein carrier protein LolA [Virgibacillus soli]